jgi:mannose-6-phosphate isomerase-like protein (cupin superfamily)
MTRRLLWMCLALPLAAADPAGFHHWTASQLKHLEQGMAGKKLASEALDKGSNYSMQVSHREAPGEAEQHDGMHDIFIVESGEATLVIGGMIESARVSAPGEIRGSRIRDGQKKTLAAGDMAFIPAKTPHQLLLDDGKQFTYAVVKVAAK